MKFVLNFQISRSNTCGRDWTYLGTPSSHSFKNMRAFLWLPTNWFLRSWTNCLTCWTWKTNVLTSLADVSCTYTRACVDVILQAVISSSDLPCLLVLAWALPPQYLSPFPRHLRSWVSMLNTPQSLQTADSTARLLGILTSLTHGR